MSYLIGVDIGGTNIKAGLVLGSRIIEEYVTKTEPKKGKKAVIKKIITSIENVFNKNVIAIGIGCPGPLNIEKGIIKNTPNLPLKGVNIRKIIRKRFKVPVYLDNDANCFVLAEALHGAGKNKNIILGLTLGTGVGGGIVINKKIFHGKGNAGELGHMTINFNAPKSKCRNNGCIESYVSSRGILSRLKGLYIKDIKELYELAKKDNKKALKIFEDTGFYLGIGLANLINAVDPDTIVIGGKIANAWKFFNKKMKETVKERALFKNVSIIKGKLRNGGIIGAASLCHRNLRE